MRAHSSRLFVSVFLLSAILAPCVAQDLKPVVLPKPRMEGGKPLLQALKERKSTRGFSQEKLSAQTLSDMLWAACGVNRPDGRRTAPSAMNSQEIDLYVTLPDGVYLYEPEPHRLRPVAAGDMRAKTGSQPFVAEAALNLVYVEDQARFKYGHAKPEEKIGFASFAAGAIAQNVYLFCASEGLATVLRASADKEGLAKALKLRPEQRVIYAQSVGYPKK
jgi:SagB-type dehydrogenase family enzyme